MAQISNTIQLQWPLSGIILTDRDINILFEIFGPLPVGNEFTMRGDSLIGLGRSRLIISNQDQLNNILLGYIDALTEIQQIRVKELLDKWLKVDTKVVKFSTAERVKFRVSAPEEIRTIIKRRIQTYIPIYTKQEITSFEETGDIDNAGNGILRG